MTLESLQQDANNPNVRKLLDIIANTEGTDKRGTGGGYDVAFGNRVIQSLADHPRKFYEFNNTSGGTQQTSAAGRYQFLSRTWDDVAKKYGLKDFTPANQDVAAIELIRRAGALEQAKGGDLAGALKKLGGTWASLPSSPYAQPKVSQASVDKMINGGKPADSRANFAAAQSEATPHLANSQYIQSLLGMPAPPEAPPAEADFAAMAAISAPPQDPYASPVSFDSPLFGPSPLDALTTEANKIWDNTQVKLPGTA